MRIAICDDEAVCRLTIHDAVGAWAERKNCLSAIDIKLYASSENLLEMIENGVPFDLYFLDIQMPNEVDGMKLAYRIRRTDEHAMIVFITNYLEYACEGYHVDALRYLRKPIFPNDIAECMEAAYARYQLSNDKFLVFDTTGQTVVLPIIKILYIEVLGHMITLHATEGKNEYTFRETLSTIRQKLSEEVFAQCHKSFVVNLMHVREFNHSGVILSSGDRIPVTKTYYDEFESRFERFFLGKRL